MPLSARRIPLQRGRRVPMSGEEILRSAIFQGRKNLLKLKDPLAIQLQKRQVAKLRRNLKALIESKL